MTADEFFTTWNNKPCNPDGGYGNQCVDVADQYSKDVVGVNLPPVNGAIDLWTRYPADSYDKIKNIEGPDGNSPQKGDMVIWGDKVGKFGHVGIAVNADVNHLSTFDQNWPAQFYVDKDGNQIGIGLCHYQTHNYFGILGWLRPKSKAATITSSDASTHTSVTFAILNDQTKYDFGGDIGEQELGAIRSIINDTRRDLTSMTANRDRLAAQLSLCVNDQHHDPVPPTIIQTDPFGGLVNWIAGLWKTK